MQKLSSEIDQNIWFLTSKLRGHQGIKEAVLRNVEQVQTSSAASVAQEVLSAVLQGPYPLLSG